MKFFGVSLFSSATSGWTRELEPQMQQSIIRRAFEGADSITLSKMKPHANVFDAELYCQVLSSLSIQVP